MSRQGSGQNRNLLKLVLSNRVGDLGDVLTTTGISVAGIDMNNDTANNIGVTVNAKFAKLALTEEGQDKLKGSFFVKVPRDFVDPPSGAPFTINTNWSKVLFKDNGEVDTVKALDFETEALDESNLDLYWESAGTFSKDQHGALKCRLIGSNCIARIGDYPG